MRKIISGLGLMFVASIALAQPLPPATTTYTRGVLRATNAEHFRILTGISNIIETTYVTNLAVPLTLTNLSTNWAYAELIVSNSASAYPQTESDTTYTLTNWNYSRAIGATSVSQPNGTIRVTNAGLYLVSFAANGGYMTGGGGQDIAFRVLKDGQPTGIQSYSYVSAQYEKGAGFGYITNTGASSMVVSLQLSQADGAGTFEVQYAQLVVQQVPISALTEVTGNGGDASYTSTPMFSSVTTTGAVGQVLVQDTASNNMVTLTARGVQSPSYANWIATWSGPTNTLNVTNEVWHYHTSTDVAITNIAGLAATNRAGITLCISNSAASAITLRTLLTGAVALGSGTTNSLSIPAAKRAYWMGDFWGVSRTNYVTTSEQ